MISKIMRLSSLLALNLLSDANAVQMESDLRLVPASLLQLGDGPDLGEDNDMIKDPSDIPAVPTEKEILKNKLLNFL